MLGPAMRAEALPPRGRFIVFEGGEGSGKSTQAELLGEHLDALVTRQPGGTRIGAQIRSIVLEETAFAVSSNETTPAVQLSDRAEFLLMAADRAQHVDEVIEPTLSAGRHVVCDRYIGSSIAYQGYGRGLDVETIRSISGWAAGGLWPDVTILLSVEESVASQRIGGARDRIEAAGADFHQRVLEGFRAQAIDEDDWWIEVDGDGTPQEVHERVLDAIDEMLGSSLDPGSEPAL